METQVRTLQEMIFNKGSTRGSLAKSTSPNSMKGGIGEGIQTDGDVLLAAKPLSHWNCGSCGTAIGNVDPGY